jgi:hypothetical protein
MLVATAVALQAILSWGIHSLGLVGAQAAAANLAGQAVIHGIAVAGAGIAAASSGIAVAGTGIAIAGTGIAIARNSAHTRHDVPYTQGFELSSCEQLENLLDLARQYDEGLSGPHDPAQGEANSLEERYDAALAKLARGAPEYIVRIIREAQERGKMGDEDEESRTHFVMELRKHFQCK